MASTVFGETSWEFMSRLSLQLNCHPARSLTAFKVQEKGSRSPVGSGSSPCAPAKIRSTLLSKRPRSKAEQVADFHEKLAAIVQVAVSRSRDVPGNRRILRDDCEILQIAVVSDVDRRARVNKVSHEKVGVELALSRQVCVGGTHAWRSCQQCVVLEDQAKGELRRELPVPFASQNVVVQDAASGTRGLRLNEESSRIVGSQALE